MKATVRDGWRGEVSRGTPVTQIDVDSDEVLTIEPGDGHWAIVLLLPLDASEVHR